MSDAAPANPPAAPSPLTVQIYDRLAALMQQPQRPENLAQMLRLLAKWRASMLVATMQRRSGSVVQAGPFAGMRYVTAGSEGSTSARLLGVYEASLHPIFAQIIQRGYAQVIDVGCAEGYYAVGLARAMGQTQILARDVNPAALNLCAQLAAENGVQDRVTLGGAVGHGDFDLCLAAPTVVICDIEGAEAQLLDPSLAPGLLAADILVEVHDCFAPGLSQILAQRFAASHDVQIIHRALLGNDLPAWMESLSDLDRLLALWEWRAGPTPWLWMQAKSGSKMQEQP